MKMKHIIKSAFIFMGIFACVSCADKFLDTSLDTFETPEIIETNRDNITNFGNAFYAPLPYGLDVIDNNFFESASDIAQQTSATADVLTFNKGILSANNNPLSYNSYNRYYEGIRAANYYLDFIADGKGEALLQLNRNIIRDSINYRRDLRSMYWFRAEAHIAKAFYYGELIKMYGGIPLVDSLYTEVGNKKIARTEYDQVVNHIVTLIDTWKDSLNVNWDDDNWGSSKGRFDLGTALAIKSRILLHAASPRNNPSGSTSKWEAAAAAAYELINHPDVNYNLASDYRNYFLGDNSMNDAETIYVVRRGNSNRPERENYPVGTPGGNSGVTPTLNLVSQYEMLNGFTLDPANPFANRDPRLEATVVVNGSQWNGREIDMTSGKTDDQDQLNASRTGFYLKKYLQEDLNLVLDAQARHNWVLFRYAEILLNYAEAMNELYGPTGTGSYGMSALDAVQMVRDRASTDLPSVSGLGKEAFRDVIKRERMIELAFEDHRYWDLLRWNDAMTVLNSNIQGYRVSGTSPNFTYTVENVATRRFLERNYYLPFEWDEIQNSQGTLVQNSGY